MSSWLERAKRAAHEAIAAARAAWADFRKRSKYFQYKAAIGAAYAFLIAVTIVVVWPSAPRNRLQAYVLAARADFVAGSYILVRNDSPKDWADVVLTLNGSHTFKAPPIAKGDKLRVELKAFTAKGRAPLLEAEVKTLDIETSRGSERYTVSFLVH